MPTPWLESQEAAAENILLAGLASDARALLTPHLERVQLARGEMLAEPSKELTWVYFPEGTTMARSSVAMTDGRSAATGRVTRDGATSVLEAGGDGLSSGYVQVVLPGPALRIAVSKLTALALRSPELRQVLGSHNQEVTHQAAQIAACNALHAVRPRLCSWLLFVQDCLRDGGGPAEVDAALPLTQEMLGDALGVRRTTVTAVAMRLQQEGLVRYERGRVQVLDRTRLEGETCECYGTLRQRRKRLLAEAVAV